jgi:hypothetical protein
MTTAKEVISQPNRVLSPLIDPLSADEPFSPEINLFSLDELEENKIAEEIEVENEEVDSVNDHVEKAIAEAQSQGKSEHPSDLLSGFENLPLDAWAANTLHEYRE